jgi:hypothetical protein
VHKHGRATRGAIRHVRNATVNGTGVRGPARIGNRTTVRCKTRRHCLE